MVNLFLSKAMINKKWINYSPKQLKQAMILAIEKQTLLNKLKISPFLKNQEFFSNILFRNKIRQYLQWFYPYPKNHLLLKFKFQLFLIILKSACNIAKENTLKVTYSTNSANQRANKHRNLLTFYLN